MLNLFGRKRDKIDPESILMNLENTIDILEKRQKFLQVKIKNELDIAKTNGSTKRSLALRALKRKRGYEEQVNKLEGAIFNIEQQKLAIESTLTNKTVFDTMKEGSNALNDLQKGMSVEDVEDTTDDIREQIEINEEIGQALGQDISMETDNDELEKELALLELEELEAPDRDLPKPTTKKPNKPLTYQDYYKTNRDKKLEGPIGQ